SAVDALGLSFENLRSLTPEKAFEQLAEALNDVDDPMKRDALGADLFGRSFAQIIPVIKNLKDETGPWITMNAEQVSMLDSLGDMWVKVKASILPATVAFVDQRFQISESITAWQAYLGIIGKLPQVHGDAKKSLDDYTQSVKDRAAVPLAMSLTEERRTEQELAAAMAESERQRRAQIKAAEDYAAAAERVNIAERGYQGALDDLGDSVVNAIRNDIEHGASLEDLAKIYEVNIEDIRVIQRELKNEEEQTRRTTQEEKRLRHELQTIEHGQHTEKMGWVKEFSEAERKATQAQFDNDSKTAKEIEKLWGDHYDAVEQFALSDRDYKIAKIEEWRQAQYEAFQGSEVQWAAYAAAVDANADDMYRELDGKHKSFMATMKTDLQNMVYGEGGWSSRLADILTSTDDWNTKVNHLWDTAKGYFRQFADDLVKYWTDKGIALMANALGDWSSGLGGGGGGFGGLGWLGKLFGGGSSGGGPGGGSGNGDDWGDTPPSNAPPPDWNEPGQPKDPTGSNGPGDKPNNEAYGGVIGLSYFGRGGIAFRPIGTDTVPAMLTPGEGIINVDAMRRLGRAGLAQLNAGGQALASAADIRALHDEVIALHATFRAVRDQLKTQNDRLPITLRHALRGAA